jgi:hypothetical protein
MSEPIEQKYQTLITSAKLSGRIDLLMEMRDWLDEKIKEAEAENERLRGVSADRL